MIIGRGSASIGHKRLLSRSSPLPVHVVHCQASWGHIASCPLASAPPCLASVIPVAREISKDDIFNVLSKFIDIYLVILSVRVVLMLFATLDWNMQPFSSIRNLTDPYLRIFRISVFGIDLSPFLAIIALLLISKQLGGIVGFFKF